MLDLIRLKVTSKRVDVKGICHVRFFLGLAELSSVSHGAGEIHSSCRFIDQSTASVDQSTDHLSVYAIDRY